MRAGLVALAPDVNLKRAKFPAPEGQPMLGQFGLKTIHVSVDESAGIAGIFQNFDWQLQPIAELPGQGRQGML